MSNKPKIFDKVIVSAQSPQVLAKGGFLTMVRRQARNGFSDGTLGPWYDVESVLPRFRDAVVLLLFRQKAGEETIVTLRRAARPSLCLRGDDPLWRRIDQGQAWDEGLWELPAGGVETEDLLPDGPGIRGRASLEAWEEVGLRVDPTAFFTLGPSPLQAPAFCPERLHYLAAAVEPSQALHAMGDGHPMEEGSQTRFLALAQALGWCRDGRILDTKTEVGLHRLAAWETERLSGGNERKKP